VIGWTNPFRVVGFAPTSLHPVLNKEFITDAHQCARLRSSITLGKSDALDQALLELRPRIQFADNDLDKIYSKLGEIIGSWLQEQGRLNKLPTLVDLRVASNHMNAVFQTLEGARLVSSLANKQK